MKLPPHPVRTFLRKRLKNKGTEILLEAFGETDPETLTKEQKSALQLVRCLCDDLPTELVQRYIQRIF